MKVLALSLALSLTVPIAAKACSCGDGSTGDLLKDLADAKAAAPHIYYARVEGTGQSIANMTGQAIRWALRKPPYSYDDQAELLVLEVFKGTLVAGRRIRVPAGGTGDCTIHFEVGDEVLVYSADREPTSVRMCNRTHLVRAGDSEMVWLRTGLPPLVPVAVRKQQVTCSPCSLESVAGPLPQLFDKSALAAFASGGSFWNGGYLDAGGPLKAVARTPSGVTFELIQRPGSSTSERCLQRVSRRTCTGLVPAGRHIPGEPDLTCANPGAEETLICDETTSRAMSWSPLLDLASADCWWGSTDTPRCDFRASQVPLASTKPSYPLLECAPQPYGDSYSCRVIAAPKAPTDSVH